MIKRIDSSGSLIVLSSYLFYFFVPNTPPFIPAIFPFFVGIIVSAFGLAKQTNQKQVIIYVTFAVGIFGSIFLFLLIFPVISILMVFITPALVASSSLIITSYAENDTVKLKERKESIFEP